MNYRFGVLLCALVLCGCSPMRPFLAMCALADAGRTDGGVPVVQMYCEPQAME